MILAAVLMFQMLPTTAFALGEADKTDHTTTVSYTVVASLGYYEVEIPTSFNTNESEYLSMCAANVTIKDNQLLTIRIDSDRTFTDGIFLLKNAYGESIITRLYRVSSETGEETCIDHTSDPIIATYANGATVGDYLRVAPSYSDSTRPGVYEGNLYFTIGIENVE